MPEYTVCAGDDDGEPVGQVYSFRSFRAAEELAKGMARVQQVELVRNAV